MAYHMYPSGGGTSDLEKKLKKTQSSSVTVTAPAPTVQKPAADAAAPTPDPVIPREAPQYAGTYDQQLQALYDKVVSRPDFTYNINEDALFAQYRDSYTQAGRKAMEDAMGQAATLTGGYGSSYGQSVGQQAYGSYLQKLHDMVPTLEQRAYDRHRQEYDDLLDQYSLTWQRSQQEYQQYLDALSQYQTETDTAYDRLQQLITATGYTPTAQELADANMSQKQAAAFKQYYTAQSAPKYTASKSDTRSDQAAHVDLKALDCDNYPALQSKVVHLYETKGPQGLVNMLNNWTSMGYMNETAAEVVYQWVLDSGARTPEERKQQQEEKKQALLNSLAESIKTGLQSLLPNGK